jgi:hypothetical protein
VWMFLVERKKGATLRQPPNHSSCGRGPVVADGLYS